MKNKYANNFTNFVRNKQKIHVIKGDFKDVDLSKWGQITIDNSNILQKEKEIDIDDAMRKIDYLVNKLQNETNINKKYIISKKIENNPYFIIIKNGRKELFKQKRDEYIQNRWNLRKRERELRAKLVVKEETVNVRRKI